MSTYFKYAERKATNEVNWAEISSNMVDTLNEAVKIREEKKAAIDKATNELGNTLADAPQGASRQLPRLTLTLLLRSQSSTVPFRRAMNHGTPLRGFCLR